MRLIKLDPRGYFLIRINRPRIEIAHCAYKGKKIKRVIKSKYSDYLLKKIKEDHLCSRNDHYAYMEKELKRAENAIKNNRRFIQG